jgi:hypothetical protein
MWLKICAALGLQCILCNQRRIVCSRSFHSRRDIHPPAKLGNSSECFGLESKARLIPSMRLWFIGYWGAWCMQQARVNQHLHWTWYVHLSWVSPFRGHVSLRECLKFELEDSDLVLGWVRRNLRKLGFLPW